MSYSVRVLAQPAVAAGFRLAGLPSLEAASPADGARQVATLLDEPGLGVILVEADIFDAISEEVRHELSRRPLPMVVPFPGPSWERAAEGPEAFIADLLRQAIGYRVKLA
ncbi:MAG: Vacuolar H+transporting two-sector ATPase subunit [Gemmatimonadetes bacterium]|nr:Vacuolar H+transporting two-sector ATPase subunit [Gemmatimonadota bacterium]